MTHRLESNQFVFRRIFLGLLIIFAIIFPPDLWSATYRCVDAFGISVLTDSPAQLEKCALLLTDSPQSHVRQHAFPSHQTIESSTKEGTRDNEPSGVEAEEHSETNHDIDSQGQESSVVTVPVTPVGGSLVLPVRLNDEQTVQLILDTGATMMVLSTDVAIELGLLSGSQNQISTVNTAGGSIQVNMTHLKSVQVGSAKASNVAVAIHDLPDTDSGIDGLLGMSYLDHFLVTLDTKQKELHLRPRSTK